jgi:hypothetical protein
MSKSPKFSPEVIERAERMLFDANDQYPSQWPAIESIAGTPLPRSHLSDSLTIHNCFLEYP